MTNYHTFRGLKQHPLTYLTVSVRQEYGPGLVGSLAPGSLTRVLVGLCSHRKAQLRHGLFPARTFVGRTPFLSGFDGGFPGQVAPRWLSVSPKPEREREITILLINPGSNIRNPLEALHAFYSHSGEAKIIGENLSFSPPQTPKPTLPLCDDGLGVPTCTERFNWTVWF